MSNDNNSSQNWKLTFNRLLNRLSIENRYRCAAGIPGPLLEMRSGTLPKNIAHGNKTSDFTTLIADVTGLEYGKLRKYAKKIADEYSFIRTLRKYNAIAFDLRSRLILVEDYIKAFIRRLRGFSINSNPINKNKIREIRLHIHDQIINIAYPSNFVSLGLLWEIFVEEVYYLESSVERIYDLGANIGLSAVYFHLLNPSAELVCIEPLEENLHILERNLHNNDIPARLIPAVVSNTEGQANLFFSDQSHALPSLYIKQSKARKISVLPFDKIINGTGYGLKIDIESAEGSLIAFPSIIENSAWIVGELHYSGDIKRDSLVDAFFDIVKSNFVIKKSRPIIYFVGDEVVLCETFKTLKKIKNPPNVSFIQGSKIMRQKAISPPKRESFC